MFLDSNGSTTMMNLFVLYIIYLMDVPVKLQSTGLYLIKILQEHIVSSILAIIESTRMTLILTVEQLVNSLSIKISIDHPNRKYTAFKFMYII